MGYEDIRVLGYSEARYQNCLWVAFIDFFGSWELPKYPKFSNFPIPHLLFGSGLPLWGLVQVRDFNVIFGVFKLSRVDLFPGGCAEYGGFAKNICGN